MITYQQAAAVLAAQDQATDHIPPELAARLEKIACGRLGLTGLGHPGVFPSVSSGQLRDLLARAYALGVASTAAALGERLSPSPATAPGPYREEFGAIHHASAPGFLFTVNPPIWAKEVAEGLNALASSK